MKILTDFNTVLLLRYWYRFGINLPRSAWIWGLPKLIQMTPWPCQQFPKWWSNNSDAQFVQFLEYFCWQFPGINTKWNVGSLLKFLMSVSLLHSLFLSVLLCCFFKRKRNNYFSCLSECLIWHIFTLSHSNEAVAAVAAVWIMTLSGTNKGKRNRQNPGLNEPTKEPQGKEEE